MVYLYSMLVAKDDKTNTFLIPFCDKTAITVMPLFEAFVANHFTLFENVIPIEVIWF